MIITSEEILMLEQLKTLNAQLDVKGLKSIDEFRELLLSETIPVSFYYPAFRIGMGNMFNFLLWVGRSATTKNRFAVLVVALDALWKAASEADMLTQDEDSHTDLTSARIDSLLTALGWE